MRTVSGLHRPQHPRAAGFSLAELLVTVLVVAEILIIAGLMFDLNNRTAKAQTQIADTQQSLRVAQREMVKALRMAGRGGLPANLPPRDTIDDEKIIDGIALKIDDNATSGTEIVADEPSTRVVEGTDVLRVRGVLTTPLYQLLSAGLGESNLRFTEPAGAEETPGIATAGEVDVLTPSPTGFPQDLTPLLEAPEGSALLLVSPLSDSIFAVVAVSSVVAIDDPPPGFAGVTVSFEVTGHDHDAAYRPLFRGEPNLPNNLTSAAFAGLIEEQVFYVRESFAIPGDPSSDLTPKLARVRVHPGTQVAIDGTGDDVAGNVLDLQLALGYNSSLGAGGFFDSDNLDNLVIDESEDGEDDDWLFNASADDAEAAPWVEPWAAGGTPQPELYYVRISTLARTEGRQFQYTSPPIEEIENRLYAEEVEPAVPDPERSFHRRMLRTVVDLRNL